MTLDARRVNLGAAVDVFAKADGLPPGKLSGSWKSSTGSMFFIKDYGDRIQITNLTKPEVAYDARRNGELVIAEGYGPGPGVYVNRIVWRIKDADHLQVGTFDYRLKDSQLQC
jgi:hypothetical protein